jgi:hypothetical protein
VFETILDDLESDAVSARPHEMRIEYRCDSVKSVALYTHVNCVTIGSLAQGLRKLHTHQGMQKEYGGSNEN